MTASWTKLHGWLPGDLQNRERFSPIPDSRDFPLDNTAIIPYFRSVRHLSRNDFMAAENALGLVIRTYDWSESSRIAVLFTREFGKVRVLAKGGRRLKSNFEVALDLLNLCSIVLLRKNGEGLELLTEARIEERFPALKQNLAALNAGYYLAELLDLGTQDHDSHPELFEATIETLRHLGNEKLVTMQQTMRFELAWLREIGYGLQFEGCSVCGDEWNAPERVVCSAESGGAVCLKCRGAVRELRPISRSCWDWLREPNAQLSAPQADELRGFLGYYVSHHLGRRPKLLNYLI
jgi:DNA repair protein RecO (recombination protein O)